MVSEYCIYIFHSLNILGINIETYRQKQVLLVKGVLKICSKFTEEHPCQSVISIKLLLSNIIFI